MLKILSGTITLAFSLYAHADVLIEREEILDVAECSAPKAVTVDGQLKTQATLSYAGCNHSQKAKNWIYVQSKAEVALPGTSSRIELNVAHLCESLKAELTKQIVHIEDSLCMKE